MADTATIDDVMAGREVPPPASLPLPPRIDQGPLAKMQAAPPMLPGMVNGGGMGQILQAIAPMLAKAAPNLSGSGGVPGRPVGGPAPGMPPTTQMDPGRPMPQAPVPHYRDPLEALGNPLTALALIASAFVRQPATTAMSALGNAVQAQRKGDQEGYLNSYREYQQQLEKVHGEQQLEMAAYKRDYDNRRLSIQESRANMRRTATRRGDAAMTAFLDAGGDPGTLLEDRAKAGKPISVALEKAQLIKKALLEHPGWSYTQAEAQVKADKQVEETKAKTGTGQIGDPNLHGREYLDGLPPNLADYVQAVGDGRAAVPPGKWGEQIREMAFHYNPELRGQTFGARGSAERDFAAGAASKNVTAINTLIGHLGRANASVDALANTNWPAANKAINKYLEETGDPRIEPFLTDVLAVAGEAGRVFKGTVTEGEIDRWMDRFKASKSIPQLKANLTELTELMGSRIQAMEQQFQRGTGREATGMLDPHSKEAFEKLKPGATPAPAATKSLEDIWK